MNERHDKLNWFDFNLQSPAANSQFPDLKGGLVFASPHDRTVYSWMKDNLQPRFGLAWNPLTHTVVRGGAGLMYMPLSLNPGGDGIGNSPNSGFSSDTPMVATLNGVVPFNALSDPFPGGLNQPTGSSLRSSTFLGQSITVWNNRPKLPYESQWNFGFQQQFWGTVFEALYEGSKGTHLVQQLQYDALPTQDFALGSALQQLVANPFYGTITTGTLAQPKVARRQLLLPYPQFTGINVLDDTSGSSTYHALAIKVRTPENHGVTALLSYTFSKEIADVMNSLTVYNNGINSGLNTSVQNPYDLRAERAVSELDTPQALAANFVAQLPFGRGRAFFSTASGVKNEIIGGWQANGIFNYRSGYPLVFSAPISGGGTRPNKICSGSLTSDRSKSAKLNEWFDIGCFVVPPPFSFGNESRTDPHLRGPAYVDMDFALEKHAEMNHGDLMFRAEAFNLTNTAHFWLPDTNAGSLTFGQIHSTTGTPRVIQLALKITF
jgi:hypothetical protein